MKNKKRKQKGYWTLKLVLKEALKYGSRSEFLKKDAYAYNLARKNKILDKCCEHMGERKSTSHKRVIYSCFFSDNSVYVGLTYNTNNRFNYHLTNKKSSVYKHIVKTGLIPEFKILTKFLNKDIASKQEGFFKEKFEKQGYIILNKIKTGGLGGSILKWTKEKCIEEALKYNTRSDFKKNNGSAYNTSIANNWLDECCKHMIPLKKEANYWTKEKCKIIALKYKKKIDWISNDSNSYSMAYRYKWLDECCLHMTEHRKIKGYWSIKENCINMALNFNSVIELVKNCNAAYKQICKNNWKKECFAHFKT